MKARENMLMVQVAPEEKKRFFRLAKRRHTTLSEIVRQLLHQECEKAETAGKAA